MANLYNDVNARKLCGRWMRKGWRQTRSRRVEGGGGRHVQKKMQWYELRGCFSHSHRSSVTLVTVASIDVKPLKSGSKRMICGRPILPHSHNRSGGVTPYTACFGPVYLQFLPKCALNWTHFTSSEEAAVQLQKIICHWPLERTRQYQHRLVEATLCDRHKQHILAFYMAASYTCSEVYDTITSNRNLVGFLSQKS